MKQYLELLNDVLLRGHRRGDRTGTGTIGVFGRQVRYPLKYSFPLVTTKSIHWKSVVHELLWFLKGDTNVKYLQDNGVRIWNEWADENGDLGPVYGKQWRSWDVPSADGACFTQTIDQISELIKGLEEDPYGRRHIVTAWNPGELDQMALPPCHLLFQFYVTPLSDKDRMDLYLTGEYGAMSSNDLSDRNLSEIGVPTQGLSCQLYQRSADLFLGVPFNVASYALLTCMVAKVLGMRPLEFVHTMGDAHIYSNHVDQVREQLDRVPGERPQLGLSDQRTSVFDFEFDDISLWGYNPEPAIKAPVAI